MALKRSSTIGVRITLEAELAQEVGRIARAQGRSRSRVIAEAVGQALAAGGNAGFEARVAAGEPDRHAERLARIEARLERVLREQAILMESVLLFVRVWLEHTPPLEEGPDEAVAAAVAAGRFERFLDLIGVTLAAGGAARAFGRDGAAWGGGSGLGDAEASL
jgi:predicted transcriptional regulator